MRSPADMDILVLDITNRCFLNCSNCTRLIAHQTKTKEMSPAQLAKALDSLAEWYKPGRVVGLIGGEPTLHSRFAEMCEMFQKCWPPNMKLVNSQTNHGREPIGDFNEFATQRLWDRSNGRGLWTSFGPRFYDHYEIIMDTFSHWNPNDHTAGGVHQTGLVDRKELCESLGITDAEWIEYRDNCWVQNKWSASITPAGAYFCEFAGQLDMLYNDGKLAWPVEPGWWKRKPDEFGEQLSICEMCSLALPGPSQVDVKDKDIIGNGHRIRLELVGSPAVKAGRFEEFNRDEHSEQRKIQTADNYTNGPRVSAINMYVRGKKLSAVIVCVGRSEHLKQTLAHNFNLVDEIVVVTSPDDDETVAVAESVSGVKIVTSRVWEHDFFAFNKGAMINRGIQALNPRDWVILTDADTYLSPRLSQVFRGNSFNPGCLYGTMRQELDMTKTIIDPVNCEPNGYFQMFHRNAKAIEKLNWPHIISERFCSAGGVDSWFAQQWPEDKRIIVKGIPVSHLAHGKFGSGWNGTPNRECWHQVGIITARGIQLIRPLPKGKGITLLLTDTLNADYGRTAITRGEEIPHSIVRRAAPPGFSGADQLMFMGRNIGGHHIHLAAWGNPDEQRNNDRGVQGVSRQISGRPEQHPGVPGDAQGERETAGIVTEEGDKRTHGTD